MSRQTDEVKWRAIVEQLDVDATRSDRAIGEAAGVTHGLVARVRRAWVEDPEALRLELRDPAEVLKEFTDEVLRKANAHDWSELDRELLLQRTSEDPVPDWARRNR